MIYRSTPLSADQYSLRIRASERAHTFLGAQSVLKSSYDVSTFSSVCSIPELSQARLIFTSSAVSVWDVGLLRVRYFAEKVAVDTVDCHPAYYKLVYDSLAV